MLKLVYAPDPVLKKKAEELGSVGPAERKLMDDMLELMYKSHGIGLAAPQVGVSQRILVMDVPDGADDQSSNPIQMVDPKIIWQHENQCEYEEGCLSFPDQYIKITRPESVRISYLDRDGQARELDASGLLAVCVQHEIDHLNGIVFVDHISRIKRDMVMRKLRRRLMQD